mmetsp:Transcript_6798/g.22647  ORF Transcript_6798/g.22647 Transcript_6798/m.22647 type:complete len:287 (+) Transcript_6798:3276-4136(+)
MAAISFSISVLGSKSSLKAPKVSFLLIIFFEDGSNVSVSFFLFSWTIGCHLPRSSLFMSYAAARVIFSVTDFLAGCCVASLPEIRRSARNDAPLKCSSFLGLVSSSSSSPPSSPSSSSLAISPVDRFALVNAAIASSNVNVSPFKSTGALYSPSFSYSVTEPGLGCSNLLSRLFSPKISSNIFFRLSSFSSSSNALVSSSSSESKSTRSSSSNASFTPRTFLFFATAVTDGGTIALLLTGAAALSPSSDCEFLLVVVLFVCMALAISSPYPSSSSSSSSSSFLFSS